MSSNVCAEILDFTTELKGLVVVDSFIVHQEVSLMPKGWLLMVFMLRNYMDLHIHDGRS